MDSQGDRATVRRLWLWPVAILVGFPIGGYAADLVVNGYVITRNIDERFPVFGAGGALVFGLLTWPLHAVLLRGAFDVRAVTGEAAQ
jgi:hypothetical protein